jgi:hypothetical protein
LLVPLIPTVALEVSVLKGKGQFMEFVPEASSLAIATIKNQFTILSIQIKVLEIRAVSTRIVGQVISALSRVEVFTERASDKIA